MTAEEITQKDYRFLLFDPLLDKGWEDKTEIESETENPDPGCSIFFDRDQEVQKRFGLIFGNGRLSAGNGPGVPLWNYHGSQIAYTASVDRNNPHKPRYVGQLTIFGDLSGVEKVGKIIEAELPKIIGFWKK